MPEGASKSDLRQRKSLLGGVVGVLSVTLLIAGISIWAYKRFVSNAPAVSLPDVQTASGQLPLPESYDSFARAVRIAEQAAKDGSIAQTSSDWLALAARWQQASDLMAEVQPSDERYQIAQDRVNAYKSNSESLLQKARQVD